MVDEMSAFTINGSLASMALNFTDGSRLGVEEGDESDHEAHTLDRSTERIVVPILFGFAFIVGIVGNGTLIYTVLRNRKMRVVPNIYIVSLSCGDFLLILITVPFNALIYILPEWPFGEIMCKVNEYLQTVSLGVSVFMLTALSADRHIAIVDPIAKHKSRPIVRAVTTAGCLWLVALLLATPDLSSSTVIQFSPNITLGSYKVCILYPTSDFGGYLPPWYSQLMVMLKFLVFFSHSIVHYRSILHPDGEDPDLKRQTDTGGFQRESRLSKADRGSSQSRASGPLVRHPLRHLLVTPSHLPAMLLFLRRRIQPVLAHLQSNQLLFGVHQFVR